jgi:chromosome segregation ATPase
MKVTAVYLDLQQAEKKKKNGKDVRKLESEAFKDPLNLQVVFDEDEKKYFDKKIEEQNRILKEMEEVLDGMRKEREVFEQYKIRVEQEINEKDKLIEELKRQIVVMDSENSEVFGDIETLKERIDGINLENENIATKTEKIKEKLERETYLFKGSDFFSSS